MSEKFLRSLTIGGDKMIFLPSVGTDNNEKVLKVIDGEWAIGTYGEVESKADPWLTFSGNEDFTLSVFEKQWDGTLYYSVDKQNWNEWDGSEISSSGKNLYMRGSGNTTITSEGYPFEFSGTDNLKIEAIGRIDQLLDWELIWAGGVPAMDALCYYYMFADCTSLVTPPELPCEYLTQGCYECMFFRCTSLTTAPKLPATTLTQHCYHEMFYKCTGLDVYTVASSDASYAWTCTGDNISNELTGMFYNCKLDGATFPNDGTPTEGTTYYWATPDQ